MKTIGDRIDKLTIEYCELYDDLLQDDMFKDKAENLTLHDLIIQQFVYEHVQKNIEVYIALKKENDENN